MSTDPARPQQFDIVVERFPERAVAKLVGELDLATAPQLRELLATLTQSDVLHITLDLEELTFVDSVGLSVVISAHKRLASAGGQLLIEYPPARIRRLFTVSGVASFLNVRPPIVTQ